MVCFKKIVLILHYVKKKSIISLITKTLTSTLKYVITLVVNFM